MNIIAACLRGIYHLFNPYFHQRTRIEPRRDVTRRESSRSDLQQQNPPVEYTITAVVEDSSDSTDSNDDQPQEHYWALLIEKCRKKSVYIINRDYRYATVYCYIVATLKDFDKVYCTSS